MVSTDQALSTRAASRAPTVAAILGLLMTVGGLVIYKATAAMGVLAKASNGTPPKAKAGWIDPSGASAAAKPFINAVDYFNWIMIALAFGIVISAAVRALVPRRWLEATVGAAGARGQVLAALAGAPLMLCSCCVSPVFEGVYARTRRLGPALGLMLAAPALNPAVLAATFLVFPASVGVVRLAAALVLVLGAATLLGRAYRDPNAAEPCPIESAPADAAAFAKAIGASLWLTIRRSLPAILLGILAAAAIGGWLPVADAARGHAAIAVVLVALVAVPIAVPTFGEIPLALALVAGGAPLGVAAALLIAGPTVNLPSLLALAKATSWRVAAATAAVVFAAAVAAGWIVLAISSV
jgi:uncharacterized membrane protein YraQ (UPF0718 family)